MISVLTDEIFFKGHLDYLREISSQVTIPTLNKDFIIDEKQIVRARNAGATVILLIVAALPEKRLQELYDFATGLGLEVLAEDDQVPVGAVHVQHRDRKVALVQAQSHQGLAPGEFDSFFDISALLRQILNLIVFTGMILYDYFRKIPYYHKFEERLQELDQKYLIIETS